jgi:type IV pilus assembly protein PilF
MRIDFNDILQKINIYIGVQRFDAAEKTLLSAIDEFGSTANLHNLLGVAYHRQSKFADAIVQFTKALKINQNFVEAGLNLSATFCDLGRYDDAQSVFSEILAITPKNKKHPDLVLGRLANWHTNCGKLYAENDLPHEAIVEYKRALSLFEKMPDTKVALGVLYFETNQLERALYEFQDSVRLFPAEPQAHLWLGITQWKMNRRGQAIQSWETSKKLDDSSGVSEAYLQFSQQT